MRVLVERAQQRHGDFALQMRFWRKPMEMTIRPADFPLGSVESRAAVRAMIEQERREDSTPFLRIFLTAHPPYDCKGKACLSGEGEPAVCHVADKGLKASNDRRTFYDVRMRF